MVSAKENVMIIMLIIFIVTRDTFAADTEEERIAECTDSIMNTFKCYDDAHKCYNKAFNEMTWDSVQCIYAQNYYGHLAAQANIDNVLTPRQFCTNAGIAVRPERRGEYFERCLYDLGMHGFQQTNQEDAFEHAFYYTILENVKYGITKTYFHGIFKVAKITRNAFRPSTWCDYYANSPLLFPGPKRVTQNLRNAEQGPSNTAQGPSHPVQGSDYYFQYPNYYGGGPSNNAQGPSLMQSSDTEKERKAECARSIINTFKCNDDAQKCYNKAFNEMTWDSVQCIYAQNYYGYLAAQANIDNVLTPQLFCTNAAITVRPERRGEYFERCFYKLGEHGFQQTNQEDAFEHAFYYTIQENLRNGITKTYFNEILKVTKITRNAFRPSTWCDYYANSPLLFPGPKRVTQNLRNAEQGPSNIAQGPSHPVQGSDYYFQYPNYYGGGPSNNAQGPSPMQSSGQDPIYYTPDLNNSP